MDSAIKHLQETTKPLGRGAAQAQQLIHEVLMNCPPAAEKAVKKADRDVRDVVVLRCRARCTNLKDREGFLEKATEAYDGQLDKEIRAQLLLAYHKERMRLITLRLFVLSQFCGCVLRTNHAVSRSEK